MRKIKKDRSPPADRAMKNKEYELCAVKDERDALKAERDALKTERDVGIIRLEGYREWWLESFGKTMSLEGKLSAKITELKERDAEIAELKKQLEEQQNKYLDKPRPSLSERLSKQLSKNL